MSSPVKKNILICPAHNLVFLTNMRCLTPQTTICTYFKFRCTILDFRSKCEPTLNVKSQSSLHLNFISNYT